MWVTTSPLEDLGGHHYILGQEKTMSSEKTKKEIPMNGADVFIDVLEKNNIKHVFGIPGGNTLPIYDALYKSKIFHILTRHEQGAAHMAEGYAKVSGKPGVVFATSGPGATNLTTGLVDARLDSVPVVAFTGQVATSVIGTDAFQEADMYGISVPFTKYNALVKKPEMLATYIQEALSLSTAKRPGPTLVDIPKDIQNALIGDYDFKKIKLTIPQRHLKKDEIKGDLTRFANAINRALKPLLYIGGGANISGADKEIRKLAEKSNIPVVMTLNGLGAFPANHRLSLGMLGMHGTRYANTAVLETDLIVSLGARFDDRVTSKIDEFAPKAKKAHIDIDPAEINKVIKTDYYLFGDLKDTLKELLPLVKENDRKDWNDDIESWKKEYPLKFDEDTDEIKPQHIIRELSRMTDGNAIIASDVGQHQMWTAQYYEFKKPRSWIASGGLGTMGFGFPAAIGAKVAKPDELVVVITGDGSFQMNIQELATIRMYNINVKILLLENQFLGMVRQWQEMFYEKRYSQTNFNFSPDFVKIAEGYGINAKRIEKKSQVGEGLDFLLRDDKSALLVARIPSEEKVFPFIPAGGSYRDMIDYAS